MGGSLLARVFSFAATILVIRRLGPAQFGLFSFGRNVAQWGYEFFDFGLMDTTIRFAAGESRPGVGSTGPFLNFLLRARIWTVGVLIPGGYLLAGKVAAFFGKPELTPAIRIGLAGTAGLFLLNLLIAIYTAEQNFGKVASATFWNSIFWAACVILLWSTGRGAGIWYLGAFAIAPFGLIFIEHARLRRVLLYKGPPRVRLPKEYKHFMFWVSVSDVAWYLASRVDIPVLAAYMPMHELGTYAAAQQMTAPLSLLVASVRGVHFPQAAKLDSKLDYLGYIRRSGVWAGAVFFAGLVLVLLAPWIYVVLSRAYQGPTSVFTILALVPGFGTLEALVSNLFLAQNRPMVPAVWEILKAVANIALCVVLVPRLGPLGAALAVLIAAAFAAALGLTLAVRMIRKMPG
jgi:O-antigen/teichoic acid export membrane protein